MRVGIFGGSFDPPHVGHLLAAIDAVEALRLDRLLFVPAGRQPLKGAAGASGDDRLAMTRAAIGDAPSFVVDDVELRRGGLSFTVDTLRHFRGRWPEASLYLLLGFDAAALLPQWREPAEVLALARLAVWTREGRSLDALPPEVLALARRGAGDPISLSVRRVDVSSTEIRDRVARGLPIRGFVPDAVAAHIAARGLYAVGPAGTGVPADESVLP